MNDINKSQDQRQAIVNVINLLQESFGIKSGDESIIHQKVESKNRQLNDREKNLQNRENSFNKERTNKLKEIKKQQNEINRQRNELNTKQKELSRKVESIEIQANKLHEKENKIEQLKEQYIKLLEESSQITKEDAIQRLCKQYEGEATIRSDNRVKEIINEAQKNAREEARRILAYSVQKETIYTTNQAISTIDLTNDSVKGKIIGREGRNIKAFEELTGVNVLVDDSPDCVVISCYDPYRREIAKLTLERLLEDGRIHPKRIEEIFEWVTKDIDNEIIKTGQDILTELKIPNVNQEIVRLLGKLKYRTSYSQNVLDHCKDVAKISANIAAEMNLDEHKFLRAGLLHDIGKALDKDSGSHAILGAEFAQKYGETKDICKMIAEHHDREPTIIDSWIIIAADSLSAGLPGARSNVYDAYVKRIEELENVPKSFKGIKNVFAMSAGREIRIAVVPEDISDTDAECLIDKITNRIQDELRYPGQILVTLVRERRFTRVAL